MANTTKGSYSGKGTAWMRILGGVKDSKIRNTTNHGMPARPEPWEIWRVCAVM